MQRVFIKDLQNVQINTTFEDRKSFTGSILFTHLFSASTSICSLNG